MAELLRFVAIGSVDDGKSTLMGRLLYDLGSIPVDQLASIRQSSQRDINLALVTDGLQAEREQSITIDIGYRHFATARRRFLIADTPGHEQYTRNMASGASTAELAVLLMDARKGMLPQTRRHASIASLLGIRKLAVVVNKMDLVDFDEAAFLKCERDCRDFISQLKGVEILVCFPVCAIAGDNIVTRSSRTPWFTGVSLLEFLESVPVEQSSEGKVRLPVQNVIHCVERRYYAGQIASGTLRIGDVVTILPSGSRASIAAILKGDQELESSSAPLSVAVALDRDVDVSSGDMIVASADPPAISRRFSATLLWASDQRLETGRPYLIKHTSKQVRANVTQLCAVINPVTLERGSTETLGPSEFGDVEIETHQPLCFDPYADNRTTGGFIIVDPLGNDTCAAGMIRANLESHAIARSTSHKIGLTVWFTGLSSAGKSTIASAVYDSLWAMGYRVEWLDGDVVRQCLSKGLGYSKDERDENVRRMGFIAELLTRNDVITLVSAITPYRAIRDEVRHRIGNYLEVFVDAPLEVCEQRDVKGIYRRARLNTLIGVTGIDDPYERPLMPDVECQTDRETPTESAARVLAAVKDWLRTHGT